MGDNRKVDFKALKERTRGQMPAVLAHYGITPVSQNEQTRIRCPFHDDERPSCTVNLTAGVFSCKAAGCGVEGGLLDFVQRKEASSLPKAAETLASICGVAVPLLDGTLRPVNGARSNDRGKTASPSSRGLNVHPGPAQREHGTVPERTAPEKVRNKPQNKALGLTLSLDLEAGMPYLTARGVTREQAEAFGLGLCTTGKTIPGRLGIPIHNAVGELVAYAGRWVGAPEDIPEGEEKYKLPAGFHKSAELYNLHRAKACQTLTIVEGYFGTIRLFGALRVPTVGLMGASVSDRQIELLKEHCPALRFVTVCLDGDEPGRKASETVAARLAAHWWVRIALLPDGMQPDTAPAEVVLATLGRTR